MCQLRKTSAVFEALICSCDYFSKMYHHTNIGKNGSTGGNATVYMTFLLFFSFLFCFLIQLTGTISGSICSINGLNDVFWWILNAVL